MKFLKGYKTVITSVILYTVKTNFFEGLIANPDLYMYIVGLTGLLFVGSAADRIRSQIEQNKNNSNSKK